MIALASHVLSSICAGRKHRRPIGPKEGKECMWGVGVRCGHLV